VCPRCRSGALYRPDGDTLRLRLLLRRIADTTSWSLLRSGRRRLFRRASALSEGPVIELTALDWFSSLKLAERYLAFTHDLACDSAK